MDLALIIPEGWLIIAQRLNVVLTLGYFRKSLRDRDLSAFVDAGAGEFSVASDLNLRNPVNSKSKKPKHPPVAYIALGSNRGDSQQIILQALERLQQLSDE